MHHLHTKAIRAPSGELAFLVERQILALNGTHRRQSTSDLPVTEDDESNLIVTKNMDSLFHNNSDSEQGVDVRCFCSDSLGGGIHALHVQVFTLHRNTLLYNKLEVKDTCWQFVGGGNCKKKKRQGKEAEGWGWFTT